MKAIILAAGLGTRLRPITSTIPKCLVPINGVPLLELWLRACERAGVEGVLVNTHHLAERVEEFVAARPGIPVTLAYEPALLGSAGTIAANWDFVDSGESFLVLYADNLTTFPLSDLIAFHATHERIASMALFRSANPSACGVVEMNDSGQVRPFLPTEAPAGLAADIGRSLMPALVGHAMGLPISGYFVDIGTLENYYNAQADYAAACRATGES